MTINRNAMGMLAVAALAFMAGRIDVSAGAGSIATGQSGQEHAAKDTMPGVQPTGDTGAPGRHHRRLDQLIGEWTGEFKIQLAPGAEPMISRGTVKREWVMNGRFVRETVEAQVDEDTFEGLGYIGYNNFDGRFEAVWMDNMSTAIYAETGTYHPDEKVLHTRGSQRDPASGRLINAWSKLNVSDPDRHVLVGYATDADGRTYKAIEGILQRRD
ncbi:MAG: DUF1579 family protein [Planctomycetota bacterium]|jgi:hypothetical protein